MSYHGSCSKCGNQGWIPSSLDGLCVDCREYKKVLCDHCKKNITTGASHARNGVIICHGCWLRLTNDSKGAEMIEHWEIGLFADGSFKLYRAEGSGPWECVHEGTIGAHRSRPGKAVVRKKLRILVDVAYYFISILRMVA